MKENKQINCPCAPCAGRCCPMMCSNAAKEAKEKEDTAMLAMIDVAALVNKSLDIIYDARPKLSLTKYSYPLDAIMRQLKSIKRLLWENGGVL